MCVSAEVYRLSTTTLYSYDQHSYRVNARETFLTFNVQACNDAHVALFDQFGTMEAYEVVLGGSSNTQSSIRNVRQQDNKVSVRTLQGFLLRYIL